MTSYKILFCFENEQKEKIKFLKNVVLLDENHKEKFETLLALNNEQVESGKNSFLSVSQLRNWEKQKILVVVELKDLTT